MQAGAGEDNTLVHANTRGRRVRGVLVGGLVLGLGLAYVVMALSRPLVLGGITLGAATLVTWAFWPGGGGSHRRRRGASAATSKRVRVDVTSTTNRGAALALVPLVPLVIALTPGTPTLASGGQTETVVHGRYLTLTSIGDTHAMSSLIPNQPVLWQVGVEAHPPETSIVNVGISAQGGLAGPGGLQVAVRACSVRWVDAKCAGSKSLWLPRQELAAAVIPVDAYGAHALGTMASTEQRWLLVEATLPAGTPPDAIAQVRIHGWGTGGEIEVGGTTGAGLANTGTSFGPSIILALGTVLSGIGLARLARRWRPLFGQPS